MQRCGAEAQHASLASSLPATIVCLRLPYSTPHHRCYCSFAPQCFPTPILMQTKVKESPASACVPVDRACGLVDTWLRWQP